VPDPVTRDALGSQLIELVEQLRVPPGAKVKLERDHDPRFKPAWAKKHDAQLYLDTTTELLAGYQDRLFAQQRYGMVVVLQGIDASGKDGTIKHVMRGMNPQGVAVHSFKVPSEEDLSHDFLRRQAVVLPSRGQIGVFNRSHYEEVLVVRVHPELLDREGLPDSARGPDIWRRRYAEINDWERYLVANGFPVLKLFLNISREEQRRRFLDRIDHLDKNWKFSSADVAERAYWDDYQAAFSEMLSHTSTEWAPWYVIPADRKWFARTMAASTIVSKLIELDPSYPTISAEERRRLEHARAGLEAETPNGAV
jgi:PPK2 family polyphosphate:nucleotide phosphotransferase